MKINLTPARHDAQLEASVRGDALTLNGEVFDFAPLPEGGLLPRDAVQSEWLASDVERIAGDIVLTLILPHGATAPQETLKPEPLDISADGIVKLPPHHAQSGDAK